MNILLVLLLISIGATSVHAQDTARVAPPMQHAAELRMGLGPRMWSLSAEYRYTIVRQVSIDAWVSLHPDNYHIGVSAWPLEWVGVQASGGLTTYFEEVVDGPSFEPEYSYAVTGMLRLPLRSSSRPKFFATVVGGPVWYVDPEYMYNGGGLIPPNTTFTPQYRQEARMIGRLELGVGLMF